MKKTLYEVVGVPPTAPREIIGAACKRRLAKFEEMGGEEGQAGAYAVREAWHVLGNDQTRAAYDASLAAPQPEPVTGAKDILAKAPPGAIAQALVAKREVPRDWARIGKITAGGLMALFAASWFALNQNARVAHQQRLEAAVREADGDGPPAAAKPASAAPDKPAEPFSAEKAEQEMREREAAAREQVEREAAKQDEEFRKKLDQENNPSRGTRRTRNR